MAYYKGRPVHAEIQTLNSPALWRSGSGGRPSAFFDDSVCRDAGPEHVPSLYGGGHAECVVRRFRTGCCHDDRRRPGVGFLSVASRRLSSCQGPLWMVTSYTQLLARRYKDRLDADADEFIRHAVDGATRMQQLIDDLLAYSRVGARNKDIRAVDCNVVLNRVLLNLAAAIVESEATVTHDPLPTVT